MASPNNLPAVTRLITSHNDAGEAVFDTSISTAGSWETLPPGPDPSAAFFLAYTTSGFPVNLNAAQGQGRGKDLESYAENLRAPPKALSHAEGVYLPRRDGCAATVMLAT